MKKLGLALLGLALAWPSPARAQDKPVEISVGYAFAHYLEEGGGSAPVGAYFSLAGTKRLSIEADVGWQRDSEELFSDTIVLNTFTATLGPRLSRRDDENRPFAHLLVGVRHDRIEGESNTALGGMTGGGVDMHLGGRTALRLGGDFQIFFDEGENVKTLRLAAGLTF